MCKCRIISFRKGLPQSYIHSRDFHFKDLAISFLLIKYVGGINVCLMQRFEYIIMLSIVFTTTENIFAMPFLQLVRNKLLVKCFHRQFESRWV